MSRDLERWEDTVGLSPFRVWVGERGDKQDVLYLRWRHRGNWKWRSLGVRLRDDNGRLLKHVQQMALKAAEEQYEILCGKKVPPVALPAAVPLTIGDTWKVITDPSSGLYPHDTPHRREVDRALKDAARILGAHLPWSMVEKSRLRQLARTRADELRAKDKAGLRGAEVTMQRIVAIAAWLRDEDRIPADAGLPSSKWREDLRSYVAGLHGGDLPTPSRPRHSLEEMRAIVKAAEQMDPRFALLIALGAELRLGQVARARRSDLDLEKAEFAVRGRGKKRGAVVRLTEGQMRAVRLALNGYLAPLESAVLEYPDYPLFPEGQLKGGRKGHGVVVPGRHGSAGPVTGTTWREWFRDAEAKADVPHIKGRGAYGVRRAAVDAVKALGISREGLQQHGGWTDTQVPDRIYADQQAEYAREEAKDKRAQLRGES